MSKLVVVKGRTLELSEHSHQKLTYNIAETNIMASKVLGNDKEVLIKGIDLVCECSGSYGANQTFEGKGEATIKANTNRVKCEGESVLLEGDKVKIICGGTIKDTSSGATSPGTAFVTVTIKNANQTSIYANKI